MELEAVKRYLEKGDQSEQEDNRNTSTIKEMPPRFFERFISQGIYIDLIEPGRLICSLKVPPRLLNAGNFFHGGATAALVDMVGSAVIRTVGVTRTGVSVEINVSYLDVAYVDEEMEIESKILLIGKAIAVVSVEFREKKTGKIVARGRHTKYLAVSGKL